MLNHIDIMGRLTADPQLNGTKNGTPYVVFSVACDRDFGEKKTDFFRVKAWKQTAEFVANYFKKGQLIIVSGRLMINDFNDREGNKVKLPEIQAEHVYFGASSTAPAKQESQFEELPVDEDLPF